MLEVCQEQDCSPQVFFSSYPLKLLSSACRQISPRLQTYNKTCLSGTIIQCQELSEVSQIFSYAVLQEETISQNIRILRFRIYQEIPSAWPTC